MYLKKHLYGNSVTKDLWEGIQEASGMCAAILVPHLESWLDDVTLCIW